MPATVLTFLYRVARGFCGLTEMRCGDSEPGGSHVLTGAQLGMRHTVADL